MQKEQPKKAPERPHPAVSPEWENSRGTTSEVPVTAPWIIPENWPYDLPERKDK